MGRMMMIVLAEGGGIEPHSQGNTPVSNLAQEPSCFTLLKRFEVLCDYWVPLWLLRSEKLRVRFNSPQIKTYVWEGVQE